MIYLTYADPPSGVFSSQVCDVVNYLNRSHHAKIRLVAFISIRGFAESRKKIKTEVSNALVLPMLPKANIWQFSIFILIIVCLLLGEKIVIARGVLACKVALGASKMGAIKKVCYDGRGAIAAEWEEYDVAHYKNIKRNISKFESDSVLKSDFRIAVSSKLIEYWRAKFGYTEQDHVIIPCTLNSNFKLTVFSDDEIAKARKSLGFAQDDTILVYSGSVAGWQSFEIVVQIVRSLLRQDKSVKLLFMSGNNKNIDELKAQFQEQVFNIWVKHNEVQKILSACNYGLLLREQSMTNYVASPTKFAEYLGAGLPVLISPCIGDYSDFVMQHDCGMVLSNETEINLPEKNTWKSQTMKELVLKFFTKDSQRENYSRLVSFLQS